MSLSFVTILCLKGDVTGESRDAHGRWASNGEVVTPKQISDQLKEHGLEEFDSKSFQENWIAHIPRISPKEFLTNMFGKDGATKDNLTGNMRHFGFEGGMLTVGATNCTVHGAEALEYEREFQFYRKPPVVNHAVLNLHRESQGAGAVKNLFKACVPMYRKMGMDSILTAPGLDAGAYAWAKYGFKYDSKNVQEMHTFSMKGRLKKAKMGSDDPELPPKAHAEMQIVEKLLDSDHPDKLWALTDIKTPHLDEHYADVIKGRVERKGTLVKWLMNWTNYYATLSMKDVPSMQRLAKYVSHG